MMAFGLDSSKSELEGTSMCCYLLLLVTHVRQAPERWSAGTLATLTDAGSAINVMNMCRFNAFIAKRFQPERSPYIAFQSILPKRRRSDCLLGIIRGIVSINISGCSI
jgi:hypothetical protein